VYRLWQKNKKELLKNTTDSAAETPPQEAIAISFLERMLSSKAAVQAEDQSTDM
jgi:hypothetical protein